MNLGVTVSVIVITYGHEDFIAQAIDGIFLQEIDFELELIIANDCSPDNTDQIIKKYIANHPKSHLIKYISHKSNIGMHANFFYALNECKGKFIAFCEGDDYWVDKTKLQSQYNILKNNDDVGLVHTDYNIFYQQDQKNVEKINFNKNIPVGNVYEDLIKDNFIATLTSMVRTEAVDKIKDRLFNLSKGMTMIDYPLWLFIAVDYRVEYINKVMACYRYLSNSASHSNDITKLIEFEESLFSIRTFFLKNIKGVSRRINESIITNYRYNRLAHLSSIPGYRRDFAVTLWNFHKTNRSIKHLVGSFYYLFKKNFK